MMKLLAFAAILALFAPALYAEDKLQLSPPPTWKDGWKQVSEQPGRGFRVMVFVPTADAAQVNAAKESVTVMEASGGPQEDRVATLYQAWSQTAQKTCSGMFVGRLSPRAEEEFAIAYAQFYCPKRNGLEEGGVDLAKILASPSSAFLVVVGKRTAPFKTEASGQISYATGEETKAMAEWMQSTNDYLARGVRACRGPALEMKCSQ